MWRLLSSLALLTLLTAEASGQEGSGPGALVGCYAVDLGEWDPALSEGNRVYQTPPDTVHLSDKVGGDAGSPLERGKMLVRPVIAHGRTPSAFWLHEGSGSVRIIWSNGHAGVRLNLASTGDGVLVGEAEAFTDVLGRTLPRAGVSLRKC